MSSFNIRASSWRKMHGIINEMIFNKYHRKKKCICKLFRTGRSCICVFTYTEYFFFYTATGKNESSSNQF